MRYLCVALLLGTASQAQAQHYQNPYAGNAPAAPLYSQSYSPATPADTSATAAPISDAAQSCNDPAMQMSPHCAREYANPYQQAQYEQQQAQRYYQAPPAADPYAPEPNWQPPTMLAPRDLQREKDLPFYSRFAISPSIGTTGVSGEAMFMIWPELVIRGGPHYLQFDTDQTIDDIDYDAELDILRGMVIADIHPTGGGFHLSAGLGFGETELDINATPQDVVNIGGNSYSPSQVGTLNGKVTNDDIAPYVGIGYDNTFSSDSGLAFRANIGVLYTGASDVDLSSTGTFQNDPNFIENLREEESNIEDDIEFIQFYPVVSVGLSYRF
tara:strand:- start:4014 stop:4994 length:981 start_codon:yes stop_codon:yes gene_type:complete